MRTMRVWVLLLGGIAACKGSDRPAPPVPSGPGTMAPHVEKSFTVGPKLLPAADLSKWLDAKRDTVLLRLPVTITRGRVGEPLRAKLGEIDVRLDDGALGVSLEDRLREACPDGATCRVWLEGRFRGRGEIQVLHFARAVRSGEAADFVEVER